MTAHYQHRSPSPSGRLPAAVGRSSISCMDRKRADIARNRRCRASGCGIRWRSDDRRRRVPVAYRACGGSSLSGARLHHIDDLIQICGRASVHWLCVAPRYGAGQGSRVSTWLSPHRSPRRMARRLTGCRQLAVHEQFRAAALVAGCGVSALRDCPSFRSTASRRGSAITLIG